VWTVDEARLREGAAEAVLRLVAASAGGRELTRALEPFLQAFCLAQARAPGTAPPPWSEAGRPS
jgi:hypothetical protein